MKLPNGYILIQLGYSGHSARNYVQLCGIWKAKWLTSSLSEVNCPVKRRALNTIWIQSLYHVGWVLQSFWVFLQGGLPTGAGFGL